MDNKLNAVAVNKIVNVKSKTSLCRIFPYQSKGKNEKIEWE